MATESISRPKVMGLEVINSFEALTPQEILSICDQISKLTIQANNNGHAITPRTAEKIREYIEKGIMYVALTSEGEVGAAVRIDAENLPGGGEVVQLGTLVKNSGVKISGLASKLTAHVINLFPERLFIATSRPFAYKDNSGEIITKDLSGNALSVAGMYKITDWEGLQGIQAFLCFQTCISCISGLPALQGLSSDGIIKCGVRSGSDALSACSLYIPNSFSLEDLKELNNRIISNPNYQENGSFSVNAVRRYHDFHLIDPISIL
jgi:hypothetical protein